MEELTTRLNYFDADVALICETKFGTELEMKDCLATTNLYERTESAGEEDECVS